MQYYTRSASIILLTYVWAATLTFAQPSRLQVSDDGRCLINQNGEVVFLNGDTGWKLPIRLSREEAVFYLQTRAQQAYNTIAIAAIMGEELTNYYGDDPFRKAGSRWDPTQPLTTPGHDPQDSLAYDYWDHLDYIIEEAGKRNMYIVFVVSFNEWVVGSGDGQDRSNILFNETNAYQYGQWIGSRYGDQPHILWMLGGDRSAVYGEHDYTHVFRAMGEGIADGVHQINQPDGKAEYVDLLMSFHPQKRHPNSATWFHYDAWLSFNSIQACPSNQVSLMTHNDTLRPAKPTWLFEGRYEQYTFDWKAWPMRFQAYLTVFAGGFGHVYGHKDLWAFEEGWKEALYAPGGLDMQHLYRLFQVHLRQYPFQDFVPDQSLLDQADWGKVSEHCWKGETTLAAHADRLQAMRNQAGTVALVYSANGRAINLHLSRLSIPMSRAYWYNPRTGYWNVEGVAYADKRPFRQEFPIDDATGEFDPPGEPGWDNDWVLVLEGEKQ